MGGKLFSTKRMSSFVYHKLSCDVVSKLRANHKGKMKLIPHLRSKESFGDIDIVIEHLPDFNFVALVSGISSVFKVDSKHYKRDTGAFDFSDNATISFQYKGVQVDLIIALPEDFDFTINYYSHNGLGNIMGVIARNLGFRLGHRGLIYQQRSDSGTFLENVVVSKDYHAAISFCGFSPTLFDKGFSDYPDIYKYVQESRFWHPDLYLTESHNYKTRKRIERPAYSGFIDYCQGKAPLLSTIPSKDESLSRSKTEFPAFKEKLLKNLEEHNNNNRFNKLFNGNLVSKYTGLTGAELGDFMDTLTQDPLFVNEVLNSDEDGIRVNICDRFSPYKDPDIK